MRQAILQPIATGHFQQVIRLNEFTPSFLDEEMPPEELVGAFLHEMGHRRYSVDVAEAQWDDADSELAAHRNTVGQLIERKLILPLQLYLSNVRTLIEQYRSEGPPHYVAAILRLQQTAPPLDMEKFFGRRVWRSALRLCLGHHRAESPAGSNSSIGITGRKSPGAGQDSVRPPANR